MSLPATRHLNSRSHCPTYCQDFSNRPSEAPPRPTTAANQLGKNGKPFMRRRIRRSWRITARTFTRSRCRSLLRSGIPTTWCWTWWPVHRLLNSGRLPSRLCHSATFRKCISTMKTWTEAEPWRWIGPLRCLHPLSWPAACRCILTAWLNWWITLLGSINFFFAISAWQYVFYLIMFFPLPLFLTIILLIFMTNINTHFSFFVGKTLRSTPSSGVFCNRFRPPTNRIGLASRCYLSCSRISSSNDP